MIAEPDTPKLRISRTSIAIGAGVVVGLAGGIWGGYVWKWDRDRTAAAVAVTGGDPTRGQSLVLRYGCAACHVIPGVSGPRGMVGPDLRDVGRRVYIGGVVTNTPANMIRWILNPRAIDPKSAMPVTGISPEEARDVAAYLYSR